VADCRPTLGNSRCRTLWSYSRAAALWHRQSGDSMPPPITAIQLSDKVGAAKHFTENDSMATVAAGLRRQRFGT
jgi:hypothetical protein